MSFSKIPPSILFFSVTNHLSPAEEDLIESSIADLKLKIAAADESARNLRKLRQLLSWDLKKLDWELQRAQKKCSYIQWDQTPPSEVLAHIFFLTIDLPFYDGRGRLPPGWKQDPLGHELMKFERVSKNWRECILSHPDLWSRILIVADGEYECRSPSIYAALLARQIRYTRQARLDVYITMSSADSRLHKLPKMVEHLLAPALKELYIGIDNAVPSDPSDELLDLFVEARNSALYETRSVADPSSFGIPWHQIIRYTSSSSVEFSHFFVESRNVLGILSAAGSLQEAVFRDMVIGSPSLQIASTSIVCPRLVSLALALTYYIGTHPIRQVFELCSFPVLARLDVMTAPPQQYFGDEYDGPETFRVLLRCIQRSRSPLCTLTFDQARVESADVTELFRTVPTLKDVRLTRIRSGIDSDIIQSLCVQENGVIHLPRLRSLDLDGHLTFDLGLFVQMVKGRWDASPLTSITLDGAGQYRE
ncbi:hypothetical protein BDZ89DRAFT_1114942 [Hymenopellis radicata]|nr:hypothetical protein BDZ89DRAFT_1114942 [Hymenopellis radicata]